MRISMRLNCVICVLLASALSAPTQLLADQTLPRKPQSAISDAVLNASGSVTCQLLDRQGRPVANELVQILQGRKLVAQTKTDQHGNFRLEGFKGGLYRVQSRATQRLFRIWTAQTAPPIAKSSVRIVKRASMSQSQNAQSVAPAEPVVRGQLGLNSMGLSGMVDGVSLITLGSSISAAALTAVTLNEINDVEDKVDRIPTSP